MVSLIFFPSARLKFYYLDFYIFQKSYFIPVFHYTTFGGDISDKSVSVLLKILILTRPGYASNMIIIFNFKELRNVLHRRGPTVVDDRLFCARTNIMWRVKICTSVYRHNFNDDRCRRRVANRIYPDSNYLIYKIYYYYYGFFNLAIGLLPIVYFIFLSSVNKSCLCIYAHSRNAPTTRGEIRISVSTRTVLF